MVVPCFALPGDGRGSSSTTELEVKSYEVLQGGALQIDHPDRRREILPTGQWLKLEETLPPPASPRVSY